MTVSSDSYEEFSEIRLIIIKTPEVIKEPIKSLTKMYAKVNGNGSVGSPVSNQSFNYLLTELLFFLIHIETEKIFILALKICVLKTTNEFIIYFIIRQNI